MVGTNRFTECRTLISFKGHPLLQVSCAPLRVTLRLPAGLPSGVFFEIVDNGTISQNPAPNPDLRVVSAESNVGIFWKELLLLSATSLDEKTVHVKIDLRPIGILLFDDPLGLHIGGNVLARTSFANCMTAITLG